MGTKNKKVSVIIPYFNTMEFIRDCLNSLLKQTYSNLEIIIINDGSDKENTDALEKLITDKRIIYIKNSINQGVAYCRNKGMSSATGEYIFFIDSDDILNEYAIELMMNNIGQFPLIKGRTLKLRHPKDLNKVDNNEMKPIIMKSPEEIFSSPSILNILFRKDFISSNRITFSTSTKNFSDLSGILPIIDLNGNFPLLQNYTYYKRVRNDPISNPSLNQRPVEKKFNDLLQMIKVLKEKYSDSKTNLYLDYYFIKYYRKYILKLFENKSNIHDLFTLMSEVVSNINNKALKGLPIHTKHQLNILRSGNLKKFLRNLIIYRELFQLKQALKGKTMLKNYIYQKILIKLPMKSNYIVFESFLGKHYADSPRNIYEYIQEQGLDYKCIWILNDKRRKIPGNAKIVKRFSLSYYYYIAVSKYWVNNMRQPLTLIKREGNVFLETWHGTPLKKLVFDMKDVHSANPKYKENFYKQSRSWDYLISPNQYSSEIFRRAFKYDKEILEYGYPRNDILFAPNKEQRARDIKKSLRIPLDKKVILYAPTWRDDEYYKPGKYKFNLRLDLDLMKEKLGNTYVVLLRMHYFIADHIDVNDYEGFAYNLSKYDDIADLYLISDILITDYSSVFFDYANLKRPILFYTYDLEKYRDTLRGFYLDIEKEAPGPLLMTSEEVVDAILNIEKIKEEYSNVYDKFYKRFCSWHDGKSTEKVFKKVFLNQEPKYIKKSSILKNDSMSNHVGEYI